MAPDDEAREALEPLDAVLKRTAAKRSTVYDWIAKGRFPRPVRIGPRRVAWRAREIDQWIANAIARRSIEDDPAGPR
jgi:prophage regulatory protein